MSVNNKQSDFVFSLNEIEAELQAELKKEKTTGFGRLWTKIKDRVVDLGIRVERIWRSFWTFAVHKKRHLSADRKNSPEETTPSFKASDPPDRDLADAQDENVTEHRFYRKRLFAVLKSVLSTLAVVAAIAVLIANLWLPVLRIYGSSMTPTVEESQIVISAKGTRLKTGDILGFYYNNKILIKRVIAGPGSWVDIDKKGNVFVDGEKIDEPYLVERAYGECDIELPYQVPEGRYFVMGDHRSTSVDSRNKAVGCVSQDQIIGKIFFRVWPIESFGFIR